MHSEKSGSLRQPKIIRSSISISKAYPERSVRRRHGDGLGYRNV